MRARVTYNLPLLRYTHTLSGSELVRPLAALSPSNRGLCPLRPEAVCETLFPNGYAIKRTETGRHDVSVPCPIADTDFPSKRHHEAARGLPDMPTNHSPIRVRFDEKEVNPSISWLQKIRGLFGLVQAIRRRFLELGIDWKGNSTSRKNAVELWRTRSFLLPDGSSDVIARFNDHWNVAALVYEDLGPRHMYDLLLDALSRTLNCDMEELRDRLQIDPESVEIARIPRVCT